MALKRSYIGKNVYEAALDRIRWVFDEFEDIAVGFSGGKDSTVTLEMALTVAREKNRLPIDVVFLDQEAEWQCVIDYIRSVMDRDEVNCRWLQIPFKMTNNTSTTSQWLYAWEEGGDWLRDKEPDAITENIYGTDRFHAMFPAYAKAHYPKKPFAYLAGVRGEESFARRISLTSSATYKHVTWGRVETKSLNHYAFYPLYDWTTTDIWKSIHDNKWSYTKLYDYMYQYGVSITNMRVSNVHHESSLKALWWMQEIERDTWNKLTSRLDGINTCAQLQNDFIKARLPPMFDDWKEYRNHLLDNLIEDQEQRQKYYKTFDLFEARYPAEDTELITKMMKEMCQTVMLNDRDCTKLGNFSARNFGKTKNAGIRTRKYIQEKVSDEQTVVKSRSSN